MTEAKAKRGMTPAEKMDAAGCTDDTDRAELLALIRGCKAKDWERFNLLIGQSHRVMAGCGMTGLTRIQAAAKLAIKDGALSAQHIADVAEEIEGWPEDAAVAVAAYRAKYGLGG